MLTAQITNCRDCHSLKELLQSVECSLKNLLRNKLNNENYNVESYYCADTVKSLSQYKRIITRKVYNAEYLCKIDNQDITFQVRKILFGTCEPCITCDDDTTSTTSSSTNTTTFTSTITTTSI